MKTQYAESARTCTPCNLTFPTITASRMHRRRKHLNKAAVALGSIKSKKKATASRLNGKKGGRPKLPLPDNNKEAIDPESLLEYLAVQSLKMEGNS